MKQAVQVPIAILDNALINRWLSFAGVSDKSMATYTMCLRQLNHYFKANNISKPTRASLEAWRDKLISQGKSASTICLYLSAAKLFFRYLAQECLYPNIAEHLKSRVKISANHKRDALSVAQSKQLLKVVSGDKLVALRDRAIIALMLTTGVRSIEVKRANKSDIRYISGNAYLYVQGKGRSDKSECVLLPKGVCQMLQAYLKARGRVSQNEPLFVSHSRRNKNARLDTQTIRKMVKSNLRKIGLDTPTLTCHSLRHTAATIMILKNQSLSDVQMVLRHKSIATTMIYNNAVSRLKNNAEKIVAQVLRI